MTRAMHELVLTRALRRSRHGSDLSRENQPSRFLAEVPRQLIKEIEPAQVEAEAVWTE
jgi:superfamily I DNA/RNA helicase